MQILRTHFRLAELETTDDCTYESSRNTALEEQRTKFSPRKKAEATREAAMGRDGTEVAQDFGYLKQAQEKYT